MILTTAGLIKIVFELAAGVATNIPANLISTKLLEKFEKDLSQVLTGLIWDEYQAFKKEWPAAVDKLSRDQLQPLIQNHFRDFTADKIADPLAEDTLKKLFMNCFLQARFREPEQFAEIDPKYRKALQARVDNFRNKFAPKFKAALERNHLAATRLIINSLAQSGKNDAEMKGLLDQIKANQVALPRQLTQTIEQQLIPVIRQAIEQEMQRFRDWDFTFRFFRGQTTEDEAANKEWLEVLTQVLEWKDFKEIQRHPIPDVPGELFTMTKEDELGISTRWVCWGCPTEICPENNLVRLAVTYLTDHKPAKAFVVSRNPLSTDRVKVLDDNDIRSHLTLDQFLQTTLNINKHRQLIVEDYEKQPIFHNFIDLQCHRREPETAALDLRSQFEEWLRNDEANHISLLGNFGTGKTVFCRRMQYELLKNYQAGQRLPVLVTLREQKGVRLEAMISTTMNQIGLKHLDYPAFRTLNRLGKFVVLIDGFDEMATYATLNEMRDNFLELAVLAEGKAKVMLTSRTHYFEHTAKEDEVLSLPDYITERPEFQVLYLNPFTRQQIEAYLDRVKGLYRDKQEVLEKMDRIRRLRELMEIPVLLDMILQIFPHLDKFGEEITLARIYQEASKNWAIQEKARGHLKELSVEDALSFMQELAWQMHQEDQLEINYKQLRSVTRQRFQDKIEVDFRDLDAFYGEIRTCTFLTRDSLGNYKFAHKSFMEYFTAAYLAPLLRNNKAPETAINEEIRQFMHQLLVKQVNNYRTAEFRFTEDPPEGMRRKEGDPFTFIHEKDTSEMVWIPPGQFIAGGEYDDDEKATRIIRLEKGAFLDKFLVTNQQYARFLNETGRFENKWINLQGSYKNERCRIQQQKGKFTVEPGYEQHPVNFVSYYGAEAYADWAGKQLPSEWLWEKAGRGIDGRTYPWGDEWNSKNCNCYEHWTDQNSEVKITPIHAFIKFPSPFGCADLSGNLWEWMIELWRESKKSRVVRGGCFNLFRVNVRLAYRNSFDPASRLNDLGFRLSRTN